MKTYFIVQDLETHEFLYPEDAIEAGEDIGGPFSIFRFYLPD